MNANANLNENPVVGTTESNDTVLMPHGSQAQAAPTDVVPILLPKPPRRPWVMITLLVLFAFAGGFVAGGSTAFLTLAGKLKHSIHHPDEFPTAAARVMKVRLSLSDVQQAEVENVMRRHQQKLLAIYRRTQPEFVGELNQMETEIAAILTPQQGERFRQHMAGLREDWLPAPLSTPAAKP